MTPEWMEWIIELRIIADTIGLALLPFALIALLILVIKGMREK